MSRPHPVQVIAVTGGKGGVGKSNVSVNLGIALAQKGRRVVLLDADLGLANIDVLLGITANRNLQDVLSGECDLKDVLVNGPGGIKIVPASSGTQRMTQLSPMEHAGLINAFSELGDQIDVLIVDTAAYALIKLMNRDYGTNRFRILANQVRNEQEGRHLYEKLTRVTERFLDVALQYVGIVPYDEAVKKAVQRQRAVLDAYPRAKASLAIRALAEKVDSWPLPSSPRGHLEFFVERLVEV